MTGNTTGWTATGDAGLNATFAATGGVVTVTFSSSSNDSALAITPGTISLGSVLVGSTPSGTSATLTNNGTVGNATYTTVATGSVGVTPANGSLAPSGTAGLVVSATTPITISSGNNQIVGTVSATNSGNVTGSAAPVNVTANVYQAFISGNTSSSAPGSTVALSLTNKASTDNGQRAGVTVSGFSTNNANFVVTTNNGGTVGTANGSDVTTQVATVGVNSGELSGTYNYSGSITATAQYTDPALQAQGGGGLTNPTWSGVTLSSTVSASTLFGQTDNAYVSSGSSYAGYGLTNAQGNGTTAKLLAGVSTSGSSDVTMKFTATGGSDAINPFQKSDTLTLGGMASKGTGTLGQSLTDPFVLQLSFGQTLDAGGDYIAWYLNGAWVNAIYGNDSNGIPDSGGFANLSYAQWLAQGTNSSLTLAQQQGAYGYYFDGTQYQAWAVLDHNSDFEVIPEPSTYAMIFSGFGMLIGFQRVRRRRNR